MTRSKVNCVHSLLATVLAFVPAIAFADSDTVTLQLEYAGDVHIEYAGLDIESMRIQACDAQADEVEQIHVGRYGDLVAGMGLPVPMGEWCSVSLDLAGPVDVFGWDADGTEIELVVDPGSVELQLLEVLQVSGDAFDIRALGLVADRWVDELTTVEQDTGGDRRDLSVTARRVDSTYAE